MHSVYRGRRPVTITGQVSINVFPDEVLLQVFHVYRAESLDPASGTLSWQRLVPSMASDHPQVTERSGPSGHATLAHYSIIEFRSSSDLPRAVSHPAYSENLGRPNPIGLCPGLSESDRSSGDRDFGLCCSHF